MCAYRHPGRILLLLVATAASCERPSPPPLPTDGAQLGQPSAPLSAAMPAPPASPAASAAIARTDTPALDAPQHDGWPSEHLANVAKHELQELGNALIRGRHPRPITMDQAEFRFPDRVPQQAATFSDGVLTVRHATTNDATAPRTLDAFAEDWYSRFTKTERVEFKVTDIQLGSHETTTRVYVEACGERDRLSVQQTSTWTCVWESNQVHGENELRLKSLRVETLEEVTHRGVASRLTDVTPEVFDGDERYREQLVPSIDYWSRRIPAALGLTPWGDCGLAIGDVNGDGLDDVYLCQPGGLPNLLYIHQPDGTVRLADLNCGVHWLDDTRSALLLDLDNDGDQDLAVATREVLLLMENHGSGQFRRRAEFAAGRDAFSLAAADYDNDGRLDIYVCRYYPDAVPDGTTRTRFSAPLPYHNATNGPPNLLLRNLGRWQFAEVHEQTGIAPGNHRWSYAAAWEDYDQDGDQDLYVANDFGPNNLYRNDGGTFSDVAESLGVLDASTGMSADWGDFDRDGRPDLYVGNMYSSAGHRVMAQQAFKPDAEHSLRDRYQRLARGNSLLRNQANGRFQDVTETAQAAMGRWAWSSVFLDLNNDGWQDLAVGNGYYSGPFKDDL